MNADEVVVARPDGTILTSGSVTRLATRGHIITGYTTREHMAPDTFPVEGYFVIDTRTKAVQSGLSVDQWRDVMRSLDWPDPRLHAPWREGCPTFQW